MTSSLVLLACGHRCQVSFRAWAWRGWASARLSPPTQHALAPTSPEHTGAARISQPCGLLSHRRLVGPFVHLPLLPSLPPWGGG